MTAHADGELWPAIVDPFRRRVLDTLVSDADVRVNRLADHYSARGADWLAPPDGSLAFAERIQQAIAQFDRVTEHVHFAMLADKVR